MPSGLCSVNRRSKSVFDMSCLVIAVDQYAARRNALELDGWSFRGEAFDELPIATVS